MPKRSIPKDLRPPCLAPRPGLHSQRVHRARRALQPIFLPFRLPNQFSIQSELLRPESALSRLIRDNRAIRRVLPTNAPSKAAVAPVDVASGVAISPGWDRWCAQDIAPRSTDAADEQLVCDP